MNVAAITIGNRDIKYEGEYFYKYQKNKGLQTSTFPKFNGEFTVRNWGEYLYDNYEKFKDKISFPIIMPFIEYLKLRIECIDKLILVATDQSNSVDKYYRNNDTIYFAKIVEQYFTKDKFVKQSKIIRINGNVADMDAVYKELKEYFRKTRFLRDIPDDSDFYISPTGGIPAINTALLLNSIVKFKNKVHQYRVDEKTANAIPISFNKNFLAELENFSIMNLMKKYFFASISEICSNNFIKEISKYAYCRMNFLFGEAFPIIEDLVANPEYRNKVLEIYTDHRNLMDDKNMKLNELIFIARIKIIQKQYIDALLCLYNFTDNLMLNKVCDLYGLEYKDEYFKKWWKNSLKKIKKDNPNIENSLSKYDLENRDLHLEESGVPIYYALTKYKSENEPIFSITEPLICLSKLRNKSFATHGFEGVSLNDINAILDKESGTDIESLISEIEKYINIKLENSVYNKIIILIQNELFS